MLQWHGPTSASDPRCRTECSRLDATARGWCLASRHRPNERRARARSSRFGRPRPLPPTAALNDGGFPGPRRLPPAGDPCRARIDPGAHRVHARFDRQRSFTRRVYRFGLARPGRLQPQPKAPTPNAAPPNRLLQPSKSMGTPTVTARPFAQNPLFRRILSSRCEPGLRTARPPELTPRAPEGKVATGRQRHESACATGSHRGPLATNCRAPHCRSRCRCFRIWSPGATHREPRPDSIRRANGEDLRQAEVLSIPRGSSRELTPRRPFAARAFRETRWSRPTPFSPRPTGPPRLADRQGATAMSSAPSWLATSPSRAAPRRPGRLLRN
jgi:hypothetical protein